jgi:hypothetical protein
MKVAYAGVFVVVAFIAGAFISSPDLRAYAAAFIGSADIIDGSIQSVDIKNGEVKNADIAFNAVTYSKILPNSIDSSKIIDGGVKTADIGNGEVRAEDIRLDTIGFYHVDKKFMSKGFLTDGVRGWEPDGTKTSFSISDSFVKVTSVILVNLSLSDAICNAEHPIDGAFSIVCNKAPADGSYVQYVVINPEVIVP